MRFPARALLVALSLGLAPALFGQQGGTARGVDDLNKEFIEKYFGIGEAEADVNLSIRRTVPEAAVEPARQADGTVAEQSGDSLSTLGKTLQIAIILLLGTLIYILSHRSRKRGNRY